MDKVPPNSYPELEDQNQIKHDYLLLHLIDHSTVCIGNPPTYVLHIMILKENVPTWVKYTECTIFMEWISQ